MLPPFFPALRAEQTNLHNLYALNNQHFYLMKHSVSSAMIFVFLLFSGLHFLTAQRLESAPPESVGMSSERLSELTSTFQQYVDRGQLPGTVTLVARKGKIVYYHATGMSDREVGKAMGEEAIFRIASQSKAIISTGIMILQERGKLLISDPLSKYIPEFKKTTVAVKTADGYEVVEADREITLRDLLTHTAGIGYGNGVAADRWEAAGIQGWYFANRDEPILETVKRMAALPNDAQPGEQFVYGYNTDILGAVVEIASGQPLDAFLRENILDPLGMSDTYFYLPEAKASRLATVYSSTDAGLERAPDPGGMVGQGTYVKGPRKSFSGGAGFLSTALDYATFLQMMLNKGVYNGHRILSRKSVELMTVNHLGEVKFPWTEGTGFGLGFSIAMDLGDRGSLGSEGEFGWGGAYHSSYWADPEEDLLVVYFTQLIPAAGVDDHGKLRALVYQAIID
jgi:CubicO group peptidase (beta-lactamase class C family)